MIVKPLDVETSTYSKGNPFDSRNKMCILGIGDKSFKVEYDDEPYGENLKKAQQEIDEADLLVLVNAKFDLHWLRKYGIKFEHKRIWDCMLVEFMLEEQTNPYPSMNYMAEKYGLPQKPDIKGEYWENGIDTTEIPYEIINEYLVNHDLPTTLKIYHIQRELVEAKGKAFTRLVSLHNQDLLVLQDIEYNGLYFNEEGCLDEGRKLEAQIENLRQSLYTYHSIPEFNTASGDHVSALLYGGEVKVDRKELIGVYKTGERTGQDKYGWKSYTFYLPQLVKPLPKTELKKEGYYATGESVLRSLKCRGDGKKVIEIILELAKLEKMKGTYYDGLPKLRGEMHWTKNMLHGNINQVVAATGRTSSTKPNLQNLASEMKVLFPTRFNYESFNSL